MEGQREQRHFPGSQKRPKLERRGMAMGPRISPGVGSSCWRPGEAAQCSGRVETPSGIGISVWEQKLTVNCGLSPFPFESLLWERQPGSLRPICSSRAKPEKATWSPPGSGNRHIPHLHRKSSQGSHWASLLFLQGSEQSTIRSHHSHGKRQAASPWPTARGHSKGEKNTAAAATS